MMPANAPLPARVLVALLVSAVMFGALFVLDMWWNRRAVTSDDRLARRIARWQARTLRENGRAIMERGKIMQRVVIVPAWRKL